MTNVRFESANAITGRRTSPPDVDKLPCHIGALWRARARTADPWHNCIFTLSAQSVRFFVTPVDSSVRTADYQIFDEVWNTARTADDGRMRGLDARCGDFVGGGIAAVCGAPLLSAAELLTTYDVVSIKRALRPFARETNCRLSSSPSRSELTTSSAVMLDVLASESAIE
jgi:hypothetical protein